MKCNLHTVSTEEETGGVTYLIVVGGCLMQSQKSSVSPVIPLRPPVNPRKATLNRTRLEANSRKHLTRQTSEQAKGTKEEEKKRVPFRKPGALVTSHRVYKGYKSVMKAYE